MFEVKISIFLQFTAERALWSFKFGLLLAESKHAHAGISDLGRTSGRVSNNNEKKAEKFFDGGFLTFSF